MVITMFQMCTVTLPFHQSWQMVHWTTAQRCCSFWRLWAAGSSAGPRAQAVCSAEVYLWVARAWGPGSVCLEPESAYSGDSSYGDPRLQSCTSSGSGGCGEEIQISGWLWIERLTKIICFRDCYEPAHILHYSLSQTERPYTMAYTYTGYDWSTLASTCLSLMMYS